MAETTSTRTTLPKTVFNVAVPNHELLKLAYDAYLANARLASATTLKRGEVSGGGKKPWRQKGTGRARFGSTRNPIWRTGGVVFGPSGEENYTKKLSKTTKRVAVKQALSVAHEAKKVSVKELPQTAKTAEVAKFLKDAKLTRKTLLVVDEKTPEIERATRNIADVKLVRATYLNVFDVLNADAIVFTKAAVKATETWLTKEEK